MELIMYSNLYIFYLLGNINIAKNEKQVAYVDIIFLLTFYRYFFEKFSDKKFSGFLISFLWKKIADGNNDKYLSAVIVVESFYSSWNVQL